MAPKFLIIGVQKAGTTTLFDILNMSSRFFGPSIKEMHFFDCTNRFEKGLDWYLSHFPQEDTEVLFEATPSYLYSKMAPERIHATFESIKLVVVFREPVSRCYSAWNMFRAFNKDESLASHIYKTFVEYLDVGERNAIAELLFADNYPSFSVCIEKDIETYLSGDGCQEPSFVRRGLYFQQVKNYLQFFDLDDFLFIEQSDLEADLGRVARKVERFMGMASIESLYMDSCLNSNKGNYECINVNEDCKAVTLLKDFYHEHNQNLFSLIGRTYPWEC